MDLRIRCPGCGHWFSEHDLSSHVNNCCPGKEGENGDWAIECECCDSLDKTVMLKKGFPKTSVNAGDTQASVTQTPEPAAAP